MASSDGTNKKRNLREWNKSQKTNASKRKPKRNQVTWESVKNPYSSEPPF
jgi:hypothetical protein